MFVKFHRHEVDLGCFGQLKLIQATFYMQEYRTLISVKIPLINIGVIFPSCTYAHPVEGGNSWHGSSQPVTARPRLREYPANPDKLSTPNLRPFIVHGIATAQRHRL